MHLRPKETDFGLLFVTNLSSFPSNLNLVPVPNGDIRSAWNLFYVNENLRRAGCGGRVVLNIAQPSDACEDKFRQLFRTHDKVPITFAARELATLVQIGLFYCNLLEPQYVDGLLCNHTVRAISAWWEKWGQVRYHIKPKDGIFGPTTVAGVIGFITGAKMRIGSIIGINKTPKDPFDASFFVESVRQFQKHEHLNRTMRIDDETEERLFTLTDYKMNNTSTGADFFGIVKSTMKEVSGKQVLSMADIETIDIDRLVNNLQGSRSRYLWLGKGSMRDVASQNSSTITGIPISSLAPSEMTTTSKDLRRAMMRTVNYQKQKTDEAIRSGVTKLKTLRRDDGDYEGDEEEEDDDNANAYPPPMPLTSDDSHREHRHHRPHLHSHTDNDNEKRRGRMRLRKSIRAGGSRDQSRSRSVSSKSHTSHTYPRARDWLFGLNTNDEGDDSAVVSSEDEDAEEGEDGEMCKPCESAASQAAATLNRRSRSFCEYQPDPDARRIKHYELRRQHSFALIEEVINRYPIPFYSSVKLSQLHDSCGRFESKLHEELSELDTTTSNVESKLQQTTSLLADDYQTVDRLNGEFEHVWAHEHSVKSQLQDADAVTSRLRYEARMLDAKLRDVEEAVETFQTKVTNLETRMDRIIQSDKPKKDRERDRHARSLLTNFI